jgi:molybdopterin-guanine dinucleotide biosynthesis protein A
MAVSTIVLAAGKQTRFEGELKKGWSRIYGITVLDHIRQFMPSPCVLVVNENWSNNEMDIASSWGYNPIKIKSGTIGESVAAGLDKTNADFAYVISGDTFCINHFPLPTREWDCYYDPWENVTVWNLNRNLQEIVKFNRHSITDRVLFTAQYGLRTRLIKWPWWVNINTLADVKRAKVLYDSSQ